MKRIFLLLFCVAWTSGACSEDEGWTYSITHPFFIGSGYDTLEEAEEALRNERVHFRPLEMFDVVEYPPKNGYQKKTYHYKAPETEPVIGPKYTADFINYYPIVSSVTFTSTRTWDEAVAWMQNLTVENPYPGWPVERHTNLLVSHVPYDGYEYTFLGSDEWGEPSYVNMETVTPTCDDFAVGEPDTVISNQWLYRFQYWLSTSLVDNDDSQISAGSGPCARDSQGYWSIKKLPLHLIIMRPDYPWCPEGYSGSGTDTCSNDWTAVIKAVREITCPVDPPTPLEELIKQHHNGDADAAENTRGLEAGSTSTELLKPEMQTAVNCIASKFQQVGLPFMVESAVRTQAYQAHLKDIFDKWNDLADVKKKGGPEWEVCKPIAETIEKKIGRPVGDGPWVSGAHNCTVSGGRNHCIARLPAGDTTGNHPKGLAIDIKTLSTNALKSYLMKDGPPSQWIQEWSDNAPDCSLTWGGPFNPPDPNHFQYRSPGGDIMLEFLPFIMAVSNQPEFVDPVTHWYQTTELSTPVDIPEEIDTSAPAKARVIVTGRHQDGYVIYDYQITNLHPKEKLQEVMLGAEFYKREMLPAILRMPVDTTYTDYAGPNTNWEHREGVVFSSQSVMEPTGWEVGALQQEERAGAYVVLQIPNRLWEAGHRPLPPGETLTGLSIRVDRREASYYESGFVADFSDFHLPEYFGRMEKGDTAPPEFSVFANHSELWPPNNKLVDINVNINVTDDYDSQPAIKLVSITANELLEVGDIQGADIGTDDRSFQLRASRDGQNHEGRVYTITYEATDAMANTVQKTIDVVVPHSRNGDRP